jgi:putative membrane protein
MTPSEPPGQDLPHKPAPASSLDLAETRTSLALRRSYLAAERTLMAWARTSLSMISFGFTMVKFFEYLNTSRGPTVGPLGHAWAPANVGFALMSIGVFALLAAILQHRQTLIELRVEGPQPMWSLALTVSALLGVLGIFAMVSLLLGQ